MAWLHCGVRLLSDKTKENVQLAEGGDSSEIQVGAATFSLNYVNSIRSFNRQAAEESLFSSLEVNATPIPIWASEVNFVLCSSSSTSSIENDSSVPSTERIHTVFLEKSLKALAAVGGASLSQLFATYNDGSSKEIPPPKAGGTEAELQGFSLPNKEALAALKFGFGPQLWTVILCDSLFHLTPSLRPLIASKSAILAVHSFLNEDLSEAEVIAELNALTGLSSTIEKYSQLRRIDVTSTMPSATDALSLLLEVINAYAPHSELLHNSVEALRKVCVEDAAEWEEEKQLLEEELTVLENLRIENAATLKHKTEVISELEEKLKAAEARDSDTSSTFDAQRVHLLQRCDELNTEMMRWKEQAGKSQKYTEALKRQLTSAEEKLERYQLEIEQLSAVSHTLHTEERKQLSVEHSRLLEKIAAVEVAVTEHVQRVESLKLEHQIKEFEAILKKERTEMLTTVAEFQKKEQKWQKLLREARDFKHGVMDENARLKERTDRQLQSFIVAKQALSQRQEEDERAYLEAMQIVKEMSPRRQYSVERQNMAASSPFADESAAATSPQSRQHVLDSTLQEYASLSGDGVRSLDI